MSQEKIVNLNIRIDRSLKEETKSIAALHGVDLKRYVSDILRKTNPHVKSLSQVEYKEQFKMIFKK